MHTVRSRKGRLAGRKHPVRQMKTVLHHMGEEARYLEEKKARISEFRILYEQVVIQYSHEIEASHTVSI